MKQKLNLGCGYEKLKDFTNVDILEKVSPDIVIDLNKKYWNLPDNYFSYILADNIIEHLNDFKNTFKNIYRISKNNCIWKIEVPAYNSEIMAQDWQHNQQMKFTRKTFDYFTKQINCIAKEYSTFMKLEVLEINSIGIRFLPNKLRLILSKYFPICSHFIFKLKVIK